MTIDRETMIRLADEVGFCGYGEDGGTFSIPVPAFYSMLGRFAALVLECGRKPLTDEEIWKFWWARPGVPDGEDDSMEAQFIAAARAIESAHGITNKESSDE